MTLISASSLTKKIFTKNYQIYCRINFLNYRQKSTASPDESAVSLREIIRDIKQYESLKITETSLAKDSAIQLPQISTSLQEFSIYSYLIDPLLFIGCSIPVLYFGYRDSKNPNIKIRYYMSHNYNSNVMSATQAGYSRDQVHFVARDRLYFSAYEAMSDFFKVRIRLAFPMFITMLLMIWYSRKYLVPKYNGVEFLWIPDLSKTDPYHILAILLTLVTFIPILMQNKLSLKMSMIFVGSCALGGFFLSKLPACTLVFYIMFSLLRTAKMSMFFPKPVSRVNKFAFMRHLDYNNSVKNNKENYQKVLEEAEKMVENKNSRIFISKEKMKLLSMRKKFI